MTEHADAVPAQPRSEVTDRIRRVAITGASGFIGRRLVAELAGRYQLRVLLREGRPAPATADLEVVRGTLESRAALAALVNGVDAVVHCAGAVRGRRLPHFAANVGGTLSLVNAAEAHNPGLRLLALSSLAAREPTLSAYAATKRAGEASIMESRLDWCILRPPAVYGPGDTELHGLFDAMGRGLGVHPKVPGGRVSVLHVDDLASAVAAWLASGGPGGIFELDDGTPGGYDWPGICELVARVRGRRVHRLPVPRRLLWLIAASNDVWSRLRGYQPMLTPGKVRELYHSDWTTDGAPFRAATGWHPTINLECGLRRLYAAADTPA